MPYFNRDEIINTNYGYWDRDNDWFKKFGEAIEQTRNEILKWTIMDESEKLDFFPPPEDFIKEDEFNI